MFPRQRSVNMTGAYGAQARSFCRPASLKRHSKPISGAIAGNETVNLGFPGKNRFSIMPAGLHVTILRHLEPTASSRSTRPIVHEVLGARRQGVRRHEIGEIGDGTVKLPR